MQLKSGKMQPKVQKVQTKCKTYKRCNSLKMKDIYNESAKVQKVQEKKVLYTMIELDEINDNIPLNTVYKIGDISVPCLRKYINDIIIEYTGDYRSYSNMKLIDNIYAEITGKEFYLKNTNNNNNIQVLLLLLNELIYKIPKGIKLIFMNKHIDCFNTMIVNTKNGLESNIHDTYYHDCTREIYRIMHLNGYNQFDGKY